MNKSQMTMDTRHLVVVRWIAPLVFALAVPACEQPPTAETGDDQELVSVTALERDLSFEGMVYVSETASEQTILSAVQQQTRTLFGPLRIANVGVAKKELADIKIAATTKEAVTVVNPKAGSNAKMVRVRYKFTDKGIVPKTMARKSSLALGVLCGNYSAQADRVLKECTANDKDAQEMRSDLWYVFDPSRSACRTAMNGEQKAIDSVGKAKAVKAGQVVQEELDRLYQPLTVRLAPGKSTNGQIWPEYSRLWAGGIEKDKVIIALVNGEIDHPEPGQAHHVIDDSGYLEMMEQMDVLLVARPNLKITATDPPTDLSKFTVNGKSVVGATFGQFIQWQLADSGYPSGFTAADKLALRKAVGEALFKRWVTLEESVMVKIGSAAARKVTIRINQFFGAGETNTPHKRAIGKSDVILYNGHSYIGSGPWDPELYTAANFPKSYQIFFIDSCISYNYYNQDYFKLKANGSQDLETITNGLESFAGGSGAGLGRFLVALLGGKQPSYLDLLKVSGTQGPAYDWGKDALRVVDGEADNSYKPTTTPIVVTGP
ncbi:MAG: hypothetical protein EXR77_04970 [Myxococcales bacterium]|nr:hypothetical protein [Myxococcales bacterium]